MKKLGFMVMPLMAASFLTGCKQPTPTPVVDVVHNFHFIGTNCTINGESDYSHDIFEKDKDVKYTIVPEEGYKLPEIVEGVEYNPSNGVITIAEIKNDIELRVEATHIPQPGTTHTIYLDPAGGTITGKTILKDLPDGYPVETAPDISRDGYDASKVKWYTGPNGTGEEFKFGPKDTGTDVVTDYFLHAKWGDITKYTVHFKSALDESAVSVDQTIEYNRVVQRPVDPTPEVGYTFTNWYDAKTGGNIYTFDKALTGDTKEITIYARFALKECNITYITNGGTLGSSHTDKVNYGETIATAPDITRSGYDASQVTWWLDQEMTAKQFTFGAKGTEVKGDINLFAKWVEPTPTETHTVTFDAGDGKFPNGEQKISFKLDSGTKLLPYIKALTPTLEGQTFAYYVYGEENDNAIDYDDTVTSDVELKANYFDITVPLTDLDSPKNISWKEIKAVATTNYNPSSCFKIGATKKVYLNEQTSPHTVRIIGFNHDYSELPDEGDPDPSKVLGITFEFANVITDSSQNAVTKHWNDKQSAASTNYDYRKSTLNDFLNDTEDDGSVINMLPSDPVNIDLKEVIKPVDKKVGVNESEIEGKDNYAATSFDGSGDYPYPYLFPLAHDEITSETSTYVPANEGKIYQYYSEHPNLADRIKRKAGVYSGNGEFYWLRSPRTDDSDHAWNVYKDGDLNYYIVYYVANAVAPAFCI